MERIPDNFSLAGAVFLGFLTLMAIGKNADCLIIMALSALTGFEVFLAFRHQ